MRPTMFISYSHSDELEKKAMVSQLGVLEHIDLWVDDRIEAGGDWQTEIELGINQAQIAILLVTANFLTSKFIRGVEVPKLLERRQREGLIVYPVIARACAWDKVAWLARMNVRPKNGAPVWREGGRYADEELAAIAREVADIVSRTSRPEAAQPPVPPLPPTSADRVDERLLLEAMENYMDFSDFKRLCFNLGVNPSNLPGQDLGLPVLLLELIGYVKRRGRYAQLVEEFLKMRPHLRDKLLF